MMMVVMSVIVFAAALAASLAVFGFTLLPALPRIVALLRDGVDPALIPVRVTIVSEPRLRARLAMVSPVLTQAGWRAAA